MTGGRVDDAGVSFLRGAAVMAIEAQAQYRRQVELLLDAFRDLEVDELLGFRASAVPQGDLGVALAASGPALAS